jgi:CpXC protein
MSQQKGYNIRCPQCGRDQDVELYESINVQTAPELKQKLLANELNAVTCVQCKLTFRVDKPLLYNDPERRLMIYLVPMAEADYEEGERQFTDSLHRLNHLLPDTVPAPEVALVFDRSELVERIFLSDAGLNPRIIEYIKHLIYSRNLQQLDPARKALLFDVQDSTPDRLRFVIQDVRTRKLESMLEYDRKAYTALCEMFDRDEQTPTLLEFFPGPHISARALMLKERKEPKEEGPPAR